MTFTLPDYLWTPQRRGLEEAIALLESGQDLCLYGPTGSGKTEQALQLMRWVEGRGAGGCFFVNRKLLIPQTLKRFQAGGVDVAVRAAEYEDMLDEDAPIQICSAPTELARVYREDNPHGWSLHEAGLIIVDEAHIQKGATMAQIIRDYRAMGARVVLLTATPIGLSGFVNHLVVSGSMAEYRACNSLVLSRVYSIEQPDMRKVKRNKTGEFIINNRKRKIYTQTIIGNVIDRWKRHNPDARATMAYWPGKAESVWGTQQFTNLGVTFCHVDATDAVVPEWKKIGGVRTLVPKRMPLTRSAWKMILDQYADGSIVGLSSRYKLREGIDVPFTYHCILATVIGSVASYVQTIGRVLRWSPETPDGVIITDHGGNYWRHPPGPNNDRPWARWWSMNPSHIAQEINRGRSEYSDPEPIRCPKCEGERLGGFRCPHCGFEHKKSVRHVVYEDGSIKTIEGPLVKPPRVKCKPDTEAKWKKMFWAYRSKKIDQTFAQMEAFFSHEHGYHPPRNLPFMPKNRAVWHQKVHKINLDHLVKPAHWDSQPNGKFALRN